MQLVPADDPRDRIYYALLWLLAIRQAHRIYRSTAGHAGAVYACAKAGVNNGYLTAGKDGFIMLWDPELQKLKQVGCGMTPAAMRSERLGVGD